jgi:hypothetical protein
METSVLCVATCQLCIITVSPHGYCTDLLHKEFRNTYVDLFRKCVTEYQHSEYDNLCNQ